MKNISKTIIGLTFLASLDPYLLIYTIPVFIIGSIILWKSESTSLTKALWISLPIVLWLPAIQLSSYLLGVTMASEAQKIDFIFPANYAGKAIIIEKIPCGQPKKIINHREQLFIPKNGVLLYQGDIEEGYTDYKYYKLLPSGKRMEISQIITNINPNKASDNSGMPQVNVWLIGAGGATLNEPKPVIKYSFIELLISPKDSVHKYYRTDYEKRFEDLTDSIVRQCN